MTPTTDVLVEAVGSYQFSMVTDPMSVGVGFQVARTAPFQFLFGDGGFDNTGLTGPHGGTLKLQTSGVIPAGTRVRIDYSFQMLFSTSAPNATAPASGSIHFTMTSVPEPTALAPLALAALALTRRRRSRFPAARA